MVLAAEGKYFNWGVLWAIYSTDKTFRQVGQAGIHILVSFQYTSGGLLDVVKGPP